ncbi:MAG: AsmA-like C-terminal region-containing protein [Bacteroidales bacterium]|nr:AsmA-like C-terminal region-containing protein [Bacteroidales bacterium]
MKTLLKIVFWTVMAIALIVIGSLLATVKLLKPQRLTPVVETVANKMLNADVTIGRVELNLQHTFPFLNLTVDSLVVVSRDIAQLPKEARDTLPVWADTLVSVGKFKGGINLTALSKGAIALNDVEISALQANMVIVNDHLTNFDIYKTEGTDTTAIEMPDIRIRSFKLTDPRPIRYADLSTGMKVEARLDSADLYEKGEEPTVAPAYKIIVDSNVASPMFDMIGQSSVPIAINGTLDWKHDRPSQLGLTNFNFAASVLKGSFSAWLDFTDQLLIESLEGEVEPLAIAEVLETLPDSVKRSYSIPSGIKTNAEVGMTFRLDKPYDMASDMIPYGVLTIDIPESQFKWQQVDLRKIILGTTITLAGSDLNAAKVEINKLVIGGPATTIDVKGNLANLLSDPYFNGTVDARIILTRLPAQLKALLGGAQTTGTITMDTRIRGRQSMLSRENFHKLKVDGKVNAMNLYYLSPDTLTMLYAHKAELNFGTSRSIETQRGQLDSLLTASVSIDSAKLLVSDIDVNLKEFKIGVGSLNKANSSDTTAIIPFGGKVNIGHLSLLAREDSSGARIRNLSGTVAMQRYHGDAHLPLFRLNAELGRVSAGDKSTRFMVRNAKLNTHLYKLPDSELPQGRREVKHLADSLHQAAPELPMDTISRQAMQIQRARMEAKGMRPRPQPEMDQADNEVIDWGMSRGFKRLLLEWNMGGTLSADRARLFTTAFPLRNRISNLNAHFNNDSIVLDGIEYMAGNSDFSVLGSISNMKRAFTARGNRQSLKINFDLISDTIDVNELANAFFTGAAASGTALSGNLDDEYSIKVNNENSDSVGPFLIPVNIDARFKLRANHVLYSDFVLDSLRGEAMAYDGALNLHGLRAASSVGSIDLSALYSAPNVEDMKFAFGMKLKDFNIHDFLQLVPAIDSIMPLMKDISGIIKADIAATADVDQEMNLLIPTLNAAISLEGDSLVFLDEETFKTMSKWLFFKDKQKNLIDHMSVQLIVENNMMQLYPFVFDFDRYRLGVQGHNDLDMNFDYHVAVLKSPLPFKFGINIKGNTDDYKIRLGKAHFNEKQAVEEVALVDTTRVNLINQFENVFRRGVRNSRFAELNINQRPERAPTIDAATDTISAADSLYLRQQGLMK